MGYWSGIYRVLKQLTPMLLKAAGTATDLKKLLGSEREDTVGKRQSESLANILEKQSEWNEQINEQIKMLKILLVKNQKYILILTIAIIGLIIAVVVIFFILLNSV